MARTERTLAVLGRLEERQARVVVLLAHVLELLEADGAASVCVVVLHHVYPPDVGAQEHPGHTASRGRGEARVGRELRVLVGRKLRGSLVAFVIPMAMLYLERAPLRPPHIVRDVRPHEQERLRHHFPQAHLNDAAAGEVGGEGVAPPLFPPPLPGFTNRSHCVLRTGTTTPPGGPLFPCPRRSLLSRELISHCARFAPSLTHASALYPSPCPAPPHHPLP